MSTVNPRDAAFTFAGANDWARAVAEAQRAIASDPEDASLQALLALGLAHQKQGKLAADAGRRAVALDPELAFAHGALGWALLEYDDVAGAEKAARAALRLDPRADYYALLGQALVRRRRWQEALEAADDGLRLNPEHEGCARVRSLALSSLGRRAEAAAVSRKSLARDPDDSGAHTAHGWLLLREGRYDEALVSFRTALRLDPSSDAARAGIVEALKARSGVYRIVLRYALWLGTLDTRTRWLIIVGLVVFVRFVRATLRANPEWWPVLGPVLALYFLFVISSWLADPISNLLLRLHPFGRLVLSRTETTASNLVGGFLAAALASGLAYFATGATAFGVLALASALMLLPIGGAYGGHGTRAWRPLATLAALIGVLGAAAVGLAFVDGAAAMSAIGVMAVGAFLYGWIANYLIMKYE